jgi:hypothetical protein
MPYELLFNLSNLFVLPFWLMMILLPNLRITKRVISSPWIVLPCALLYAGLVIPAFSDLIRKLSQPGLQELAAGLSTPQGTLIGWVHFLAFDLFTGRWIYLDSREREIKSCWVALPLLLTFMLGPLGLLLYLCLRVVVKSARFGKAND